MATTHHVVLFITVLSLVSTKTVFEQPSQQSQTYYTAGVADFTPSSSNNFSPQQHLRNNLVGYLRIIASPEAQPTDILVFPESTLNSQGPFVVVPAPELEAIPCDTVAHTSEYINQSDILQTISCAARNVSKYVVINLTEQEVCQPHDPHDPRPCSPSGFNVYNTNVVFDREGRVISRYRKQHLYGEERNTTYTPEFGIFETDFGVRFGHFVCYDILFYSPAQQMADSMGIRDFVLTSMWFGQLPFLTGVQIQSSWSFANNVNLLAAGAHNPVTGSAGVGIYNGRRQPLLAVVDRRAGVRELYVAKVPKHAPSKSRAKRQTMAIKPEAAPLLTPRDIFFKRDHLEQYATELVNFGTHGDRQQRRLCYSEHFCCNFDLSWQPLNRTTGSHAGPRYSYRLGAYDGWRKEKDAGLEVNQIKNCAVFACIGEDIKGCGLNLPELEQRTGGSRVVFNRILIEAHMPNAAHFLLMPNSLREETLLPLPVDSFQWNVTDESSSQEVRFLMNSTVGDLLTFAVYGNYYDSELKDDSTNNSGLILRRSPLKGGVLIGCLFLVFNYFT